MKASEAFQTLLAQLRQALKDAQETGARAFQEGRFGDAQAAARRGEEIKAYIEQLEALQRQWAALVQGVKSSTRLPAGQKTPQEVFWVPILAALEELGGRGRASEILDRVESMVRDRLVEVDWEVLSNGRSIRWRNTAQWARYQMVQEGLLTPDSPRGVWEITAKGRKYLEEHRDEVRMSTK